MKIESKTGRQRVSNETEHTNKSNVSCWNAFADTKTPVLKFNRASPWRLKWEHWILVKGKTRGVRMTAPRNSCDKMSKAMSLVEIHHAGTQNQCFNLMQRAHENSRENIEFYIVKGERRTVTMNTLRNTWNNDEGYVSRRNTLCKTQHRRLYLTQRVHEH